MGKKITDIASGFYLPGKYTLVWNASELASGIYLLELKQNKNISVQKAVLLK
jgi:hypothetical protein